MLLAVLLLVTTSPATPGSHDAYARQVEAARAQALRESLQVFDDYLKQHPDEDVAAVERCKLLQAARHDDDDADDSPAFPDCLKSLEKDFPLSPGAIRYRIGFLASAPGDKFAREALANPRIAWTAKDRAAVYAELALRERDVPLASLDARKAMQLDPSLDLSLQVAEELFAERRRTEGVVALSHSADGKPHQLFAKARLLAEHKSYARALWLIEAGRSQGGGYLDPLVYGDVLGGVGRLKQAREAYAQQRGDFRRKEVLIKLLLLDRSLGDEAAAVKSYEQLRDLGWKNDPLALRRISLARKFPHAHWHVRDLWGLLSLLLLVLAILLLPGFLLLPLHYRSLWLRLKKPPPAEPVSWRFRHVWLASSAFLLAQSWFFGQLADDKTAAALGFDPLADPQQGLAHLFLGYLLTMAAISIALLLFRRDRFRLFGLGSWSLGKAAAQAGVSLIVIYAVAGISLRLFGAPALAAVPPIDSMIRAFLGAHGRWLTFLAVAVAVPVIEELFFRSLLLELFTRWLGFIWGDALQAALFALAHGDPARLAFYFVFGLATGRLRHKSGGLLPGIAVHAFNNALVVAGLMAVAPVQPAPPPRFKAGPQVSAPALSRLNGCAQTATAKTRLEQAVLRGDSPWPLNNLAWEIALDPAPTAWCLQQAEELIDNALEQLPEAPGMIDTKATVLYRLGRVDEAADYEAAALRLVPGYGSFGTQLDRFLRKTTQPLLRGSGKQPGLTLDLSAASARTVVLDLGEALPLGGTLAARLLNGNQDLGVVLAEWGPEHEPVYRIPLPGSLPADLRLELALVDARGCDTCKPKQWHWSWIPHDKNIDVYP